VRHKKSGRKLGRSSSHRKAMRQNMTNALFTHGRIVTTLAKAKDVRPFAERMITLARKGVAAKNRGDDVRYLHCYRRAISKLQDKAIAKKLFEEIAPGYMDRNGGYTRILKDSKHRLGDNAPRAFFELVEFTAPGDSDTAKGKKRKKKSKAGK
jgi:large subunit ribosomal protein L17